MLNSIEHFTLIEATTGLELKVKIFGSLMLFMIIILFQIEDGSYTKDQVVFKNWWLKRKTIEIVLFLLVIVFLLKITKDNNTEYGTNNLSYLELSHEQEERVHTFIKIYDELLNKNEKLAEGMYFCLLNDQELAFKAESTKAIVECVKNPTEKILTLNSLKKQEKLNSFMRELKFKLDEVKLTTEKKRKNYLERMSKQVD